jgi:hypothetical protein
MSGFEVLPTALAEAAQAVRSFAHEVRRDLPLSAVEDPVLAAAWQDYASRWGAAAEDLAKDAVSCGRSLVADAQQYADVEAVLVPRALR